MARPTRPARHGTTSGLTSDLKSLRTFDDVAYPIPGLGIELKDMQGTPIRGRRSLDCRQDFGKSRGVFGEGEKPVGAAGVSSAAVVARRYQDIGQLQEKGDLCAYRIVALGKFADHGVRRWILFEKGIQRLQAVLPTVRWLDRRGPITNGEVGAPYGIRTRVLALRGPKGCQLDQSVSHPIPQKSRNHAFLLLRPACFAAGGVASIVVACSRTPASRPGIASARTCW